MKIAIEVRSPEWRSSARNLVFEDIGKGNGGEGVYKLRLLDHTGNEVAPEVYVFYVSKEDIRRLAKAS